VNRACYFALSSLLHGKKIEAGAAVCLNLNLAYFSFLLVTSERAEKKLKDTNSKMEKKKMEVLIVFSFVFILLDKFKLYDPWSLNILELYYLF
jgi:hypothetical protein